MKTIKTDMPKINPIGITNDFKNALDALWGLKRFQLFEFCDQTWLKGIWREAYLDGLNVTFKLFKIHQELHRPYSKWMSLANKKEVLEVCSGGGGPIDTILTNIKNEKGLLPTIILSDLNPDFLAFQKIQNKHPNNIKYINMPVDATETEKLKSELISLCSSFHHLPPDLAKKVLSNAYKNSKGIFIREVLSRNPLNALSSLFNLLPLMLAPFLSGRISFFKILISTIIPIIPLMIIFDGVVSVLRTYSNDEIIQLMPNEMQKNWVWVKGNTPYMGIFKAPYLYGYKKNCN
jgi:hypothetical protein